MDKQRVLWVDGAKGICIILVVMMHTTLGLEKAAGQTSWLSHWVTWAQPFRMPDFFLLSGLFLGARLSVPWGRYLDTKVLHFLYFFILWTIIQVALKAPVLVPGGGIGEVLSFWAWSLVEPLGTLWFLPALALFCLVARLLSFMPRWAILLGALGLETAAHWPGAPFTTSYTLVNEFASRFVYFYLGYVAAPFFFSAASRLATLPLWQIFSGLALWALVNTWCVQSGWAFVPGVSFALGVSGACAVMTVGWLSTRARVFGWLWECGRSSLVIYLAFFLFMVVGRIVVLRFFPGFDLGTAAFLVTVCAVFGPLLLAAIARKTPFKFLFERPRVFRLH